MIHVVELGEVFPFKHSACIKKCIKHVLVCVILQEYRDISFNLFIASPLLKVVRMLSTLVHRLTK